MRARVLVTRPEPGASATARRLETLGYAPILLPLTGIVAIAPGAIPEAALFGMVAVTSANAVRHAPAGLVDSLAGKPCLAVGAETAKACRDAGFLSVETGDGDAESLARLAIDRSGEGGRIAYLCGRVRRDTFERALDAAGRRVTAVETYDTVHLGYDRADLDVRLGVAPVDVVLLYSAGATAAYADLLRSAGGDRRFARSVCLGLSDAVGEPLAELGGGTFMAAETPDEEALVALLRDAFPPAP